MKRYANILLHQSAYYKRERYAAGISRHGFRVINDRNARPSEHDVLILWNRSAPHEDVARRYEAVGAKVIISENGYIGPTKAMALTHHLGAGCWYVGAENRWNKLNIGVQPWRTEGDFVLVLPQRGIGEKGVAMPRNWLAPTLDRLKKATKRPIRVRKHPGKNSAVPLEHDLRGAHCVVTWASGAGVKSIVAGVPVFHGLPNWIGAPAARMGMDLENPYLGDRMEMFHKLAWAQWTWDEIERGEPFEYLINYG